MAAARRRRRRRRTPRTGSLGSVSKRDFAATAKILCRYNAPENIVQDLAAYFQERNPRFKRARFIEATRKC